MATINLKAIATTQSNHFCPGPVPAISNSPPTPPAGPVPAPYLYAAYSRSATATADRLQVAGAPVLVEGSSMTIVPLGNAPSQPTGGDVLTHAVNDACNVYTASTKVMAGGRGVACTGDQVRLNAIAATAKISQISGVLLMATMVRAAAYDGSAVNVMVTLDPISVASGAVVDENLDLSIPGLIPIDWKRLYSSARNREHTPLGRGGWTHAYHQWIDVEGDVLRLRDADGATITVRDAKPREPAFHRGKRLVVTRDLRGGATVFSLDTRLTRTFSPAGGGRAYLREISDESGHKVVLEYEAERLVRIIDTARRTITLTHDEDGHIVRLEVFPPGGGGGAPVYAVSFAYGDDGELVRATDPLGHSESYGYDEQRRLTLKTLPNGLSFHYRYDPDTGRCIRSWGDGDLHAGDLTYDLEQGITRLTGNLEPRVFTWRLTDGSVVREASSDGLRAQDLEFDDDGLLVQARDAAGNTLTFTRDARGNVTRYADPLGPLVELEYEDDLVVRRRIGGVTTEHAYDHRGRLASVKYASGASLSMHYDEQGRLAAVYGPDGLRAGFVYDERHNVVEERTPRGGVRRFRHDALGRPVVYIDPLGRVTRRELDALGRTLALHLPDRTTLRFEYDALGRLTRRTDALGCTETFRYAGLSSPVEVVSPDGSIWSLSYDLNERLQQVKNPKGETFDLRYDRSGRLREYRAFDGRVARAWHGKNGRLARVENPDGTFRALRHDGMGRILAEETPHGAIKVEAPEERTVEYVFDDPAGVVRVRIEHDALGRVIAETQNGRTIRYEYDAQNRCTARHLPTGHVTRYAYDEEGNVTSIDHDGYRVDLQRDLAGTLLRKVFVGAGVDARREIDAMARPTRDWVGVAGRTLVDRLYVYDARGALIERNDVRWGVTRYRYDPHGMLLDASSAKGRESFEYDAGGALKPAGSAWETGPGGLLLRTEEAAYAYDEANRRTRETRSDGETEYLWDCRGQLREVRRPDGSRVLFAYDPFGRRVRKEIIPPFSPTAPGSEALRPRVVEYLWDGICLAAELDSERGLRVFVHEPGTMRPLLQQEGGIVYAVITDHLGTPTELIGREGEVAWSARHAAFGMVVQVARPEGGAPVASPFRLLGQYHDEETDLCYVRYRYFDPKVARFLSPDPLELLGGRNLFAFDGSPTTHADPLGLACVIVGNPARDRFVAYCISRINPNPNNYAIVVHGTAHHVAVPDANGVHSFHTPGQLLAIVNAAGNYNGAALITLNSCNTGRMPNGVGAQVSAAYPNRQVFAPSDIVWGLGEWIAPQKGVANSSNYVPRPGEPAPVPDPARPGQWNSFYNGMPHVNNRHDQYTTLPTPPAPPPGG